MAKELMEIGGFITEGAEIVNHDASLSGNGTVDSPLGVVPGYNETVLYDNYTGRPANIGGQITLSESPLNFEYIDVYLNGSSPNGFDNISNGYEKIPNIQLSSTNSLEFVKLFAGNNTTEQVHEVGCGYSGISGTTWTKWFGYVTNVNFTGAARKADFGNSTHLNIWRVVGINRIANN